MPHAHAHAPCPMPHAPSPLPLLVPERLRRIDAARHARGHPRAGQRQREDADERNHDARGVDGRAHDANTSSTGSCATMATPASVATAVSTATSPTSCRRTSGDGRALGAPQANLPGALGDVQPEHAGESHGHHDEQEQRETTAAAARGASQNRNGPSRATCGSGSAWNVQSGALRPQSRNGLLFEVGRACRACTRITSSRTVPSR